MADETPIPEVAAPVVDAAPVEAPVETAPVETAVETPVVETAPEAPPEAEATEAPSSLLGDDSPEPVEAKPEGEVEAPKPAISYEKFKAPEGFTISDDKFAETAEFFSGLGLTQEAGQALVDRHATEVKQAIDKVRSEQHETFAKTVKSWQDEVKAPTMADGETQNPYGGTRFDTSIRHANEVIQKFAGSKDEYRSFSALMRFSGAGNHLAMVRFLNNVWQATQPPKIIASTSAPKSDTSTKSGKVAALYQHPSNSLTGT